LRLAIAIVGGTWLFFPEERSMPHVSPEQLIRQFHENGLKLLLHDAANVRDLVMLRDPTRAARIDFARLTIDPTSYVAADYRHLCSNLVLKVPYRTRLAGRPRTLTLYLLLEHQSEPDVLMALRVLEYLVQVYKGQLRAATKGGRPRADFRLQPVLPVVLYTGERSWEVLTSLAELVEGGSADFADVVPQLRPLFLNLAAVPVEELETAGGYFGWLLELIRLRHAPAEEFHATTARVVGHLEEMAEVERERWLLFLSYIGTMIHQERVRPEHERLYELIGKSIRSDTRRREVETLMETMADFLRAEGRRAGEIHSRQQTLVRLLRRRFGRVPRATEQLIRATEDTARLDTWLDNFATAQTLADVGIGAQPEAEKGTA
jgi:hypothetical protein